MLNLIRTQHKPRHPEQYNISTDFIIEYTMLLDNFVRRPAQIAQRVTGAMAADTSLQMMDVMALAGIAFPYKEQAAGVTAAAIETDKTEKTY